MISSLASRTTLPGSSRIIRAFGDELHFHLEAKDTGGQFSLWTNITPPGGGPPPHYHENEDELFFPLEGRAEFFQDGKWTEVPVGTVVFMPRNVIHTFRNAGNTPLKLLIQTTPGGFEKFFEDCAAEFTKPTPPDMQRIIRISAGHGIHYTA